MGSPQLTFFCELPASELQSLFDVPDLMEDLKTLNAGLSLGIIDLAPERAEIVRDLNEAGIPVTAWLLLPEQQGYWFNVDNLPEARGRYQAFKDWTEVNRLRWSGVGVDIEPDIREMTGFARSQWKAYPILFKRLFDGKGVRRAQKGYQDLVKRIQADGYRVESYQLPFIIDERLARSDLLKRLTRLVDLSTDREVLMLYSSIYRPNGVGLLWSYSAHCAENGIHRQDMALGLGITGGGVDTGLGDSRPLDWSQLARDMRLAWYWCEHLYIFSLEGCVRQGFMPNLKTFQWDQVILPPLQAVKKVGRFRKGLRTALWIGAHLNYLLAGFLLLGWLSSRFSRRDM